MLLRQAREDRLEVVGEAHVEHLVGLVEHHGPHRVEDQRLALEVVERAAGRGHHHVDAALERAQLLAVALPAVDREHARAQPAAVLVDRLGDLHGELARRHEHQRLRPPGPRALGAEALQQGQGEGRGLAGAGRRLPEHVAPAEHLRNRLALDRRRLLVPQVGEHRDQLRTQPQLRKPTRTRLHFFVRHRISQSRTAPPSGASAAPLTPARAPVRATLRRSARVRRQVGAEDGT